MSLGWPASLRPSNPSQSRSLALLSLTEAIVRPAPKRRASAIASARAKQLRMARSSRETPLQHASRSHRGLGTQVRRSTLADTLRRTAGAVNHPPPSIHHHHRGVSTAGTTPTWAQPPQRLDR